MSNLEGFIFTSASSISAFTLMLMFGRQLRVIPKYFLFYLLIETIGFVLEILIHSPTSPAKSLSLGLLMASAFWVGPCVWLFAREVSGEHPNLSALNCKHWITIFIGFVLVIPLIYTTNLSSDYASQDSQFSSNYWLFTQTLMVGSVIIFAFQAPYYLIKSHALFMAHQERPRSLFAKISDGRLNALRLIILVVATTWLVSILKTLHCMTLGPPTNISLFISSVEVFVTIIALMFVLRNGLEEKTQTNATATQSKKYARSPMNKATRSRIKHKLQHAMEAETLYSNNLLTLSILCKQINESPHYVSQVINQDLNTNFFDLVNNYRVAHAKAVLLASPKKTVLEIAESSGFNSKSTFNAAFKKFANLTPSQYRNANS